MNDFELKEMLISSGGVYDQRELCSFLHAVENKEIIKDLYLQYQKEWLDRGVITHLAEDFPKYQNTFEYPDITECVILYKLYMALL